LINFRFQTFCNQRVARAVARIHPDRARLKALWPATDARLVNEHLRVILCICGGDPAAGSITKLSQRERLYWLISVRSTVIQLSPVHMGLCDGADVLLDRLEKQSLEV
jgi:hypothetical protein